MPTKHFNFIVATTCLADGYNDIKVYDFETHLYEEALQQFEDTLLNIDASLPQKFRSALKRTRKGTLKGIKIFYTVKPGIRHYLWIKISLQVEA